MRLQHLSAIIADDMKSSRDIVLDILKTTGMRDIRQAEDGGEAFALIRERAPDLLFLDLEMPYDGIRTLRQIRTAPHSPDKRLAVIIMTAYATPTRLLAMRDAGVTEVVSKPLTSAKLFGRINAVLLNPRQFIEAPSYVGPDRRRVRIHHYTGPMRRAGESDGNVFEIA